ncbi:MAG TPA: phosphoribosyl-AMP cyclohydrolase [Planctomycetota bacterium]|jgi:phosphoribosyl-AMP cyclohydrolase
MSSGKEFPDRIPAQPSVDGFLDALKYDADGLVTIVVQDADNNAVLMVAFANREAVRKTLETGLMHYYSRSRKKMWLKGEESGHTQKMLSMTVDCDGDAIVAKCRQVSGACHLGFRSCFAFQVERDGKVTVVGEKLFDPKEVYKKK